MGSFVLSDEVGELTYNFEPYGGSGVIPEPSSMQIQVFRQGLADLIEGTPTPGNPQEMAPADFVHALSSILKRDSSENDEKVMHMAADVCTGQPSYDEIKALPYRARSAFLGWLVGTLILPEVPRPVTTN
jgi:hypothetical protein